MAWLIKQTVDIARGDRAGDKQQAIRPLAYPGNENAHRWEVKVLNNGIPADLSGYSASAEFDRQDGNRVPSVSSGITGNVAWVVFPADVYMIEGNVWARLSLSKTGENTPIAAITFRVQHRSNGPVIDPGGEIALDVAQLVSAIDAAVASIPPTWTELSDEVDDVKAAVQTLDHQINGKETLTWQDNTLFNAGGFVTSAKFVCTNLIAPGTYDIVVPDGYKYYIFEYVSDTQGTQIASAVPSSGRYTWANPAYISVGKVANTNLSATEKALIADEFVVANDGSLAATVQAHGDNLEVINANYLPLGHSQSQSIASGSDLNTYKAIGVYYVANATIAGGISNMPIAAPGRLIVQNTSDAGSGVQIYVSNFGDTFIRQYNASVVGDWRSYAFEGDYLPLSTAKYTPIASGSDLDDYTTPGVYKRAASNVTVSNLPENAPGELIVLTTATANNQVQFYLATTGSVWTRKHDAGGWSAWGKIVYDSDLDAYDVFDSGKYTAIAANSDLNDYTTPGNYKIIASNIASTVTNMPRSAPGKLAVLTTATANNIVQIYIDTDAIIWTRTRDARGWGDWERLVRDSEAELLRDTANSAIAYAQALMATADYNLSFANAPAPLGLKNYVGNNQNVHPKVLYFSSRFGGHFYWMAYTPYPYMQDKYENPCIAYSDDGYTWTNIAGNPLDDPQGNGYNSDTHLVYGSDTGTLECWYRYVTAERVEEIYRQTSTDGVTWTAKEKLFTSELSGAAHYLSPAVNFDGTQYKIWVVDNNRIKYYTAPANAPGTWTAVRTYSLAFSDDGSAANPWHLDVIEDNGQYIMLVMCQYGTALSAASRWNLFITTSADNETYSTPAKILGGSPYGWDKLMYRSSIVKVGSQYRIYYSGVDYDRSYHMAISESGSLSEFVGKYLGL